MHKLLNEDLCIVCLFHYLEQRSNQRKLQLDAFDFTLMCSLLYITEQKTPILYSTIRRNDSVVLNKAHYAKRDTGCLSTRSTELYKKRTDHKSELHVIKTEQSIHR